MYDPDIESRREAYDEGYISGASGKIEMIVALKKIKKEGTTRSGKSVEARIAEEALNKLKVR